METVGAIVLIIALVSGVMVISTTDVDNEAEMEFCLGVCLEINHKMKTVNDPNNPEEELKDEIHSDIHDDVTGKHCGSSGNPVC